MALDFPSNSSYVDVATETALQNLEPITIAAWIYPTGWGGGNYGRIIDKGDSNVFFISNVGGVYGDEALVYYRTRTGAATNYRSNNGSIVLNTWQHVAVSSTSTGSVLYINGDPVSSYVASDVGTGSVINDSGNDLWIGNRSDLQRYFDGQMCDVRIYNVALDADAIKTIYASFGHDSVLGGLVARYPFFDQPPGSTESLFRDSNTNTITSAGSVTVNVPTYNDGDLLLAFISITGSNSGTATATTPSGWTYVGDVTASGTFSTPRLYVYRRVASSEPSSYTFSWNFTNCGAVGVIVSYNGDYVDTTEENVSTNNGTSNSPSCPSVSPASTSLLLRLLVNDSNVNVTYPTGTDGRITAQVSGSGSHNGDTFALADTIIPAGASGTANFGTSANEQWGTMSITFNASLNEIKDISNNEFNGEGHTITFTEDILSHRRRV